MRKRLVRGISSIMGTLLVLSITIALGGLLYMYSQGLFNNLTKSSNVPVTVQLYSAGANEAVLYLSVQNPSNQVVQITSVKVMYEGQVIASNNTLAITVPAGNTVSTYVILSTSQAIVSGDSYTVVLSGTMGNNQFGQVVNVIASG
ncbi:MAG: archaellin/type IV pilin N-terminal domain-containing protein [Sulfolobales archaeon]|nr:archaellin/type IV pilin N-terminal domain-containing protein [Sulfolobales archaeon]MDT7905257.1 archaellin/type IV pilin N-terminal domain-containing protein [Sulfolobales archaeon]